MASVWVMHYQLINRAPYPVCLYQYTNFSASIKSEHMFAIFQIQFSWPEEDQELELYFAQVNVQLLSECPCVGDMPSLRSPRWSYPLLLQAWTTPSSIASVVFAPVCTSGVESNEFDSKILSRHFDKSEQEKHRCKKKIKKKLMRAEFNFNVWVSGSQYCVCWFTVTLLGHLNRPNNNHEPSSL